MTMPRLVPLASVQAVNSFVAARISGAGVDEEYLNAVVGFFTDGKSEGASHFAKSAEELDISVGIVEYVSNFLFTF